MLQTMQRSLKENAQGQLALEKESEDSLAQADTLKIVACPICQAIYVPSVRQLAAEWSSLSLLESEFLALCHTCFRCQRPACPQCWHPLHHACASCSEEAQLPFRSPVPSLAGLVLAPQKSSLMTASTFTCLRDGRFCRPEPSATVPGRVPAPVFPAPVAVMPALASISRVSAPLDLSSHRFQNMSQPKAAVQMSETLSSVRGSSDAASYFAQPGAMVGALQTTGQPAWPQTTRAWPRLPEPPLPKVEQRVGTTLAEGDASLKDISLLEKIENVLIVVLVVLILAILLMIVLALSSDGMNTFFFHLLHLDIRMEILYLLRLR